MIPDDVTVQVLTQAREHIIKRTFEAVKGAPHAVIHLYNSTSVAQREQVFRKDKEQVKQLAIDGGKITSEAGNETDGNFTFEYSPESFHGTEVDYAVEVCNAVLDVWQPTADNKAIINIPTTVENAMPHTFACQLEYVHKHLKHRENVVLSFIRTMTEDAVWQQRNLVFLQELTVSKVHCLETENVPVTLILSHLA